VSTIIHIKWEGPYRYAEVKHLRNDISDYGIYQIYGPHAVYGSGVLLYIGKAAERTFGQRVEEHSWCEHIEDPANLEIYVGRLAGTTTPATDSWIREIDLAERLIIHTHSPAYNSQGIQDLCDPEVRNVRVFNWGKYRSLQPEVSGERWGTKAEEIEALKIYGE
jgi:hypothetical protein